MAAADKPAHDEHVRDEPEMQGYQLGWRQQEILDALRSGPWTTTELNASMGDPGPISITLTRNALCLLEQRGLIRRQEADYGSGRPIMWRLVKR